MARATPREPVVAFGASAGGLEALLEILPRLAANGRTRYILAQHMSKTGHADLIMRVLGRHSALPVVVADADMPVVPDVIHVLPAGQDGVYDDGRIHLREPAPSSLSTPSVNVLFTSVARNCGHDALGVVLSGAGSDGVEGSQAIRRLGGHVIVQGGDSAAISGMAGAVERAGAADQVLSATEIASFINGLVQPSGAAEPMLFAHPYSGSPRLQVLLQRLSTQSGVDFTMYRQGTLLRRMQRRCEALHLPDLDAYVSYAMENADEQRTMQRMFLISWSWFYRDRAAFDRLRIEMAKQLEVLPSSVDYRIWVPGCASGEEAYTLAMIARDLAPDRGIEVIGSDLNSDALTIARTARYPDLAMRELPPDLRERFTRPDGDRRRVNDGIRELCAFHQEDVLTTPPQGPFDLVSCRNLLIYMKRELHRQLLDSVHASLRAHGLLFLGLSEGLPRDEAARFTTIDATQRIYRRRAPA